MLQNFEKKHRKISNLNNREAALALLKEKKIDVLQVSKQLRNDKSFALEVVISEGSNITFFSKKNTKR